MTREEILKDKARYDEIAAYNEPIVEKAKNATYDLVDLYKAKYSKAFGLDDERYRVAVNTYYYGSGDRIVSISRTDKGGEVSLRWDLRVEYNEDNDEVKFESNSWSGANVTSLEAVDDLVESASVLERILKYPDFKADYLTIKCDLARIVKERSEALKPFPDDLKGRNFERELKDLEYNNLKERLFSGKWYAIHQWDKYHKRDEVYAIVRVRRQTDKTVWYDMARESTKWENGEIIHTGEYYLWSIDTRCLKSNFSYAPTGKFEAEFTEEEKENYSYRYEAMPDDFNPKSRWE